MAERAPFDPSDEFDAMADWFRVKVCELAQEASKAAIYRDLPDGRRLECFMAGAFTGAVGVCLAMTKPEGWDTLMVAIGDYLPDARRNAEEILEDGRKRLAGAP